MKECVECTPENYNPLNLKAGDVVEQTDGWCSGDKYLVCNTSGKLRLHGLGDGNVWWAEQLMSENDAAKFKKVNVCYKVVD